VTDTLRHRYIRSALAGLLSNPGTDSLPGASTAGPAHVATAAVSFADAALLAAGSGAECGHAEVFKQIRDMAKNAASPSQYQWNSRAIAKHIEVIARRALGET
jgi:hypothetical protein